MKTYRQLRRFTLLELLVAMAVLIILAMVMFEIVNQARQAWSAMQANTRIYENARIVFDVIGRDLQSAVASDEPDREIPFYVWEPYDYDNHQGDSELLSFVSVTRMVVDPADPPESDLAEIAYSHTTDTNADYPFSFLRSVTQDNNTANWNFYTNPDNWEDSREDFHEVIRGVEELSIVCMDAGGNVLGDDNDDGFQDSDRMTTTLPRVVQVSITLFDPRAMELPDGNARDRMIYRTRRTFNKMIYLRAEGF